MLSHSYQNILYLSIVYRKPDGLEFDFYVLLFLLPARTSSKYENYDSGRPKLSEKKFF